jgi:hypothetical protein
VQEIKLYSSGDCALDTSVFQHHGPLDKTAIQSSRNMEFVSEADYAFDSDVTSAWQSGCVSDTSAAIKAAKPSNDTSGYVGNPMPGSGLDGGTDSNGNQMQGCLSHEGWIGMDFGAYRFLPDRNDNNIIKKKGTIWGPEVRCVRFWQENDVPGGSGMGRSVDSTSASVVDLQYWTEGYQQWVTRFSLGGLHAGGWNQRPIVEKSIWRVVARKLDYPQKADPVVLWEDEYDPDTATTNKVPRLRHFGWEVAGIKLYSDSECRDVISAEKTDNWGRVTNVFANPSLLNDEMNYEMTVPDKYGIVPKLMPSGKVINVFCRSF